MNSSIPPFEDILDALMLEESEPTYAALIRWSERFPEYGELLADFFATWAVQAELPQEFSVEENRIASLAVSQALDILHHRSEEAKRTQKVSVARPWLFALALQAGISEEQLEERAKLDDTITEKLDLCRLTDIPNTCFRLLSMALCTSPSRIEEMATGPPLMTAGTRHKTHGKPVLKTEEFAEAVRNSNLSEDDKRFWLEAVAIEREAGKE